MADAFFDFTKSKKPLNNERIFPLNKIPVRQDGYLKILTKFF